DVMNVSGHRISSYEVESALVDHPSVAEAAVIGKSHEIKGQGIAVFVTVKEGVETGEKLLEELKQHVAHKIGEIASQNNIFFTSEQANTRSAKIMLRIMMNSPTLSVVSMPTSWPLCSTGSDRQLHFRRAATAPSSISWESTASTSRRIACRTGASAPCWATARIRSSRVRTPST